MLQIKYLLRTVLFEFAERQGLLSVIPWEGRLEFNSCPARIRSQAFLFPALMLRRDAWQRSRNKNARWRAGMS